MATQISKVNKVVAATTDAGATDKLHVGATGEVPTTGWSGFQLLPRYYPIEPSDGIWDFDFVGDPPSGYAGQVIMPASASFDGVAPPWLKGVRVHAANNSEEATVARAKLQAFGPADTERFAAFAARPIFQKHIATYDDSFQPIGMCSLFSIKMKKLRHELILVVEGPDEAHIRHCVDTALAAAIIAALVAAFTTGGIGLQAAISAAVSALTACLGAGYQVRFDNRSHWIEWCT